jgi:hypothetical protein
MDAKAATSIERGPNVDAIWITREVRRGCNIINVGFNRDCMYIMRERDPEAVGSPWRCTEATTSAKRGSGVEANRMLRDTMMTQPCSLLHAPHQNRCGSRL